MKTKFFEEFEKESKGAFPEIKLNSATYYKEKHELVVRFTISTFVFRAFEQDKKDAVLECVQKVVPGMKVSVQYIKAYADESSVKNRILDYFNKFNQMIFRRLKDDSIVVFVDDNDISVTISLETPVYKLLIADTTMDKLTDALDSSFSQNIQIKAVEIVVDPAKFEDVELPSAPEIVYSTGGARLVRVVVGEKIYSRFKIDGINRMPNYITDVKSPAKNIILCGKISNMQKREYNNKRYEEGNPKNGPQKLPIFSFILDDTTCKMDSVCFPKPGDMSKFDTLNDRDQIVCIGNADVSKYSGNLSFSVDAIFRCSIDMDSIQLTSVKPIPERYVKVTPKPYTAMTQGNMLEDNSSVPEYLKNKTFVVFDFEATDKNIMTAEPIELAAVKVVNGVSIEVFQTFIKPTVPIPEFITGLTTITDEMVEGAPSMEQILPDFYKFTRKSILVGHNISGYDYPLLKKYADKEGYNFDNDMDDTLLMAREYLKSEITRFDLETLAKRFAISHENAHRAIADVYATVDLLKEIAKRM